MDSVATLATFHICTHSIDSDCSRQPQPFAHGAILESTSLPHRGRRNSSVVACSDIGGAEDSCPRSSGKQSVHVLDVVVVLLLCCLLFTFCVVVPHDSGSIFVASFVVSVSIRGGGLTISQWPLPCRANAAPNRTAAIAMKIVVVVIVIVVIVIDVIVIIVILVNAATDPAIDRLNFLFLLPLPFFFIFVFLLHELPSSNPAGSGAFFDLVVRFRPEALRIGRR